MRLKINNTTISPLLEKVGMDLTHFMKYYTTIIMYFYMETKVGGHVLKYSPHFAKGPIATTGYIGVRCACIFFVYNWYG